MTSSLSRSVPTLMLSASQYGPAAWLYLWLSPVPLTEALATTPPLETTLQRKALLSGSATNLRAISQQVFCYAQLASQSLAHPNDQECVACAWLTFQEDGLTAALHRILAGHRIGQ